jgi:hypothetical protein
MNAVASLTMNTILARAAERSLSLDFMAAARLLADV